jgi:hypothetical protein
LIVGENPGSSGKKNEGKTPSKEAGDKDKEESAGSIKSHKKGDKKNKKMKKMVESCLEGGGVDRRNLKFIIINPN